MIAAAAAADQQQAVTHDGEFERVPGGLAPLPPAPIPICDGGQSPPAYQRSGGWPTAGSPMVRIHTAARRPARAIVARRPRHEDGRDADRRCRMETSSSWTCGRAREARRPGRPVAPGGPGATHLSINTMNAASAPSSTTSRCSPRSRRPWRASARRTDPPGPPRRPAGRRRVGSTRVSDDGSEPPPPPPPNLSPPPGYTAYTGRPSTVKTIVRMRNIHDGRARPDRRIGRLPARSTTPGLVDKSKDFLAGRITETAYKDDLGRRRGRPAAAAARSPASWCRSSGCTADPRAHAEIGPASSRGVPGWAIGGWFLPPGLLYVIPMLVLRETWKAADPDVPPGDDRWKSGSVHPLLWVWWVLYGLAPLVFVVIGLRQQIGNIGADDDGHRQVVRRQRRSAVRPGGRQPARRVGAWAALVWLWTDRHRRLDRAPSRQLMSIFVVRHAKAGSRHDWDGDDDDAAADQVRAPPVGRHRPTASPTRPISGLWSSPLRALRADARAARPRRSASTSSARPRSAEGVAARATSSRCSTEVPDGAVLCSHGDVIPELLDGLVRRGTTC